MERRALPGRSFSARCPAVPIAPTGQHRVAVSQIIAVISFAAFSHFVHAAAPTLEHLHPIALQRGTTNSVMVIGKFDSWPLKTWTDAPGVAFQAEKEKGKFTVVLATNAPTGPHLVRVFNDRGASKPRFLIVAPEPETLERETNDAFASPQQIDGLPASINGRLDKSGDVDSFGVRVAAGQTLVASVDAVVLGSPVDALLRIVDSRGVQVAWNHDGGRTMDPFLAWTAPRDGKYIVQVMGFAYPATSDIRFHGGESCIYRLKLSTGPFLSHTRPLGVQRGHTTKLQLAGWNFSGTTPREFVFDGATLPADCSSATLAIAGFQNSIEVPAGSGPELNEDDAKRMVESPIHAPAAVTGCIDVVGEQDRYAFAVTNGEKLHFEAQSSRFGFPLDAWLRIDDATAKVLARNDDGGGPDPKLDWTAPTNGTFSVIVGSLLQRGGSNFLYRLAVTHLEAGFRAVVADSTFAIKPGGTNEIKVTVKRLNGFSENLTIRAANLPEGISAKAIDVPQKGDAVLKIFAATNAPPYNGPFRLLVSGPDAVERAAVAEFTGSTVDNGVPGGFGTLVISATDRLWLTVLPRTASTNNPVKH